jgi:hypothetical protein
MTRPAPAFLHQQATASSLGLARVLVFGIWFVYLAIDPLERLAELPLAAFDPPGVLKAVPDRLWELALQPTTLLAFKAALLVALGLVVLGLPRSRVLLGLTAAGLVAYQGLVRGFSGHMNHAELALLYISMLFVFFPVFDGLTVRTVAGARRAPAPTGEPADDPARRAPYVAGMLAACLVLSLTYFFVGAVRLWKGIDLFGTSTLRDLVASFALADGRLSGSFVSPLDVSAAVLALPLWVFQVAFLASTLIELAAPLALFSRRLRLPIVLSLLFFHVSILVFMNVPFPENMALLALFSGSWFHRAAAWLDRTPPAPRAAPTAAPESARSAS